MKVAGIVAEYNPFHNGHLYHLKKAKELTNCDYSIAIMSGNFLQRGVPALCDKYMRAEMACRMGLDAVLEIPSIYSSQSSEFYATASVLTLERLGIVDYLCFGAETENMDLFYKIVDVLIDEPATYKTTLKTALKFGCTFPVARITALEEYFKGINSSDNLSDLREIINKPNNILALDYLKAIKKYSCKIKPVIIKRFSAQYHDISINNSISSATAIRESIISSNTYANVINDIPHAVYTLLENNFKITFPIVSDDFSYLLNYQLIKNRDLTQYCDFTSDLGNRIKYTDDFKTFSETALALKSKQYTLTRINRILLNTILEYKKEDFENFINDKYVYYCRLLGFNKKSSSLLKAAKENTSIPIINKLSDGFKSLDENGRLMLNYDINSALIYNLAVKEKYNTIIKDDYRHPIVII